MLGALLGAALALGVVWIVAAVIAQTPDQSKLREDIQRSAILQELNVLLPPSGPILNALARLDPLPSIAGPSPDVAAPSPRIARTPGVRAASRSVVRVLGTACGLAIEGSGWVGCNGPDHHQRARRRRRERHDGAGARPAAEPAGAGGRLRRDRRHSRAACREPRSAHPAARRRSTVGKRWCDPRLPAERAVRRPCGAHRAHADVLTDDAYGRGPVSRLLTPLRGLVRPGNSGGPLVDGDGAVLTTVFAGTVGGHPRGGYGVANSTVERILSQARAHAAAGGASAPKGAPPADRHRACGGPRMRRSR